jgi:hypothetical protein
MWGLLLIFFQCIQAHFVVRLINFISESVILIFSFAVTVQLVLLYKSIGEARVLYSSTLVCFCFSNVSKLSVRPDTFN